MADLLGPTQRRVDTISVHGLFKVNAVRHKKTGRPVELGNHHHVGDNACSYEMPVRGRGVYRVLPAFGLNRGRKNRCEKEFLP
jgi:hypothetical protein